MGVGNLGGLIPDGHGLADRIPGGRAARARLRASPTRRGHRAICRRLWLLLLLAGAGLAGAGPAVAQTADQAELPAAVDCACRLSFSYAEPQRYKYWRREEVHADLLLRLSAGDGVYRTAAESRTTVCTDVREERKGEPFHSVDMCIEMGQWLERIREEARCSLVPAGDGKVRAECRLPNPDPTAGAFLTARQAGEDGKVAMCNAFAHMAELRLAADIASFEADNLHGLPDLRHDHRCLPR